MNINFQYDGSIKDVMPIIKAYLEEQKYDIIHYAPESGFILTDYKLVWPSFCLKTMKNKHLKSMKASWANSKTNVNICETRCNHVQQLQTQQ